jgi:phosphoglycolate phosphatase
MDEHKALLGAIFDLDGTLVDTLDDIADAMNTILMECQYPTHPAWDYKFLVGEGIYELSRRVLPPEANTDENINKFVQRFRELYNENWHAKSKPYSGVVELLQIMSDRGIQLAVLSNKPDSFCKKIVQWFFPNIPFKIVQGEIIGQPTKPDPFLALQIKESMGLESAEIAFIGDSGIDMQTAVNSGMTAFGVSWGFRPVRELVEQGAQHIIHTPAELLPSFFCV